MVMRISGLASGMDIDDIVSKMMTAQRVPLDKLYQKKTYTEWQRDDYRTINTALSEFQTLIKDGIGKQSSFIKKTVSVSNEAALSVKNVNSIGNFSGTVKIKNLATAASISGTVDESKTITAGQTITIKAINKDGKIDQVAQKNPDGTVKTDADGKTLYEDKVFTYEVQEGDTLDTIISKINDGSGVTAVYNQTSRAFSIVANNTGIAVSGNAFTIESTGNFLEKLGYSAGTTSIGYNTGKNAVMEYNGVDIERTSNNFRLNGIEFTLKQADSTGNTPITFSSATDSDAIIDTVKKFVESYNGLIATINSKTSEKKNANFPPLTDAQKEAMSEDQIKKWEEQARKGTLRNDGTLNSLTTKMRTALYTEVEGTQLGFLSKIGITPSKDYLDNGKLELDETKLKEAIDNDPNAVYELFNKQGTKEKTDSDKGFVSRLTTSIKSAMDDIGEKAGGTGYSYKKFALSRILDDYEKRISAFETKLTNLETRYYKQFSAMETAISKANSQSANLSSYFTS
ncbi:flagellar hook-associated protein 2 [Peribacillus asahii]|uniref:flagellar hook-associated protein 2 n=1 Tax=Peribacillus asahii TaxID=228899 RepID=UPI003814F3EC